MKRKNPPGFLGLGIDLNTVITVGGLIFVATRTDVVKAAGDQLGKMINDWANDQLGVTPVGGTLPDGETLNFGVGNVNWSGFAGLARSGDLVDFTVQVAHSGRGATATVYVELFDGAGNMAWQQAGYLVVGPDRDQTPRYYTVNVSGYVNVNPGLYAITVHIEAEGNRAATQPAMKAITVLP